MVPVSKLNPEAYNLKYSEHLSSVLFGFEGHSSVNFVNLPHHTVTRHTTVPQTTTQTHHSHTTPYEQILVFCYFVAVSAYGPLTLNLTLIAGQYAEICHTNIGVQRMKTVLLGRRHSN